MTAKRKTPTFAVALRAARTKRKLTQAQVADRMGVDAAVVSQYETGRRVQVQIRTIRRFAEALGCHPGELMT